MGDTTATDAFDDWFFANRDTGVRDKIADLHSWEFADDLDWLLAP